MKRKNERGSSRCQCIELRHASVELAARGAVVVVGDMSESLHGATQASGKFEDVGVGDMVIDAPTVSSRKCMLLHCAVGSKLVDLHHLVEHMAVETFLEVCSSEERLNVELGVIFTKGDIVDHDAR